MVKLVPFPAFAVPRIYGWMQAFWGAVADDFAPKSLEEFMADWERQGPNRMALGIERDGEIGGVIVVDRLSDVVGNMHIVCKRTYWGRETTLVALREACKQAFDDGLIKLMCTVFPSNSTTIHLALQCGFEREGRLEQHTLRGGKPCDLLIYGLTKERFEQCQSESPQPSPSVAPSEPEATSLAVS